MSKKNQRSECCSEHLGEGAISFTAKPYASIFSAKGKQPTYCTECGWISREFHAGKRINLINAIFFTHFCLSKKKPNH